jgi:MFS family permease
MDAPSSPLRHPAFRALWIASVFSYMGTWVQDVAQSWLMLSLTKSPLPVAMLTTFFSIPTFLLMLPSGVLADRYDRRRILLVAQSWAALVATVIAIVAWTGRASPAWLLAGSAAFGVGTALTAPAWQSLLPDLVSRKQMAEAITLNSVSFNIARATGPALGGLILAWSGPAAAFAINALSFLAVIEVLRRFPHIRRISEQPRGHAVEPVLSATAEAFVHVWRSPRLRALMIPGTVFALAAASVPALLAVFAERTLHTNERGYGILVGALGVGAITGGVYARRLRLRWSPRAMISSALIMYAVAVALASTTQVLAVAALLLVPAGFGYVLALSTLNTLIQLSTPRWIMSRVVALYNVLFFACWAIGASVGGEIARRSGVPFTMLLAGVGTLAAAFITASLPLPSFDERAPDTTPMPTSVR